MSFNSFNKNNLLTNTNPPAIAESRYKLYPDNPGCCEDMILDSGVLRCSPSCSSSALQSAMAANPSSLPVPLLNQSSWLTSNVIERRLGLRFL